MNQLHRIRNRKQRGYVLLMVMVLVLVLTLLTSRLVQSSYFDTYAMTATQMQSQAVLNSNMGVQEGLARLRSGQVIAATLPLCLTALDCPVNPPATVYLDNTDPKLSRYAITVFLRRRVTSGGGLTFIGSPSADKLVVVSSEGFAYNGLGEANRAFSSLTEVEVALPQGNGIPGSGQGPGNSNGGT